MKDIHKKCEENGYHLSYSSLGYYFWPKNWNTKEGKRHIYAKYVNIKLAKSQSNARKTHKAHSHCWTLRQDSKKLCAFVGEKYGVYLGIDNKAVVPVGINCAIKQTPIMMQVRQQVRLQDHTVAVGPGHKLCPSVYLVSQIVPNMINDPAAIRYNGDVYVPVRSCSHNPSSPASPHMDIHNMVNGKTAVSNKMKKAFWDDGKVKPCWFINNDGGSDVQSMCCIIFFCRFGCM